MEMKVIDFLFTSSKKGFKDKTIHYRVSIVYFSNLLLRVCLGKRVYEVSKRVRCQRSFENNCPQNYTTTPPPYPPTDTCAPCIGLLLN